MYIMMCDIKLISYFRVVMPRRVLLGALHSYITSESKKRNGKLPKSITICIYGEVGSAKSSTCNSVATFLLGTNQRVSNARASADHVTTAPVECDIQFPAEFPVSVSIKLKLVDLPGVHLNQSNGNPFACSQCFELMLIYGIPYTAPDLNSSLEQHKHLSVCKLWLQNLLGQTIHPNAWVLLTAHKSKGERQALEER
eukprot:c8076_g1_i1.p1 GENE.c8076_g1_i1~~c8076_g1_i1.p1  ORF type:complete len:197 (-),score=23.99 c8076_g1_i1:511-1101(-)